MTTLYALVIKETKEILDPIVFKKYWKNYGTNQLYGWSKPKKIYTKLGHAKTGFSHVPEQLKPHIAIASFAFDQFIIDGDVLQEEQIKRKEEKRQKSKERWEKRQLADAEARVKRAQEELEKLKA
jgi:hypothetical protein